MIYQNLIGRRFGKLLVIGLNNSDRRGASWLCRCDCGNKIVLATSRLLGTPKRNPEKSCGCSQKKQNGDTSRYPRAYKIWKGMIDRCYRPHRDNFQRYGAKGVKICDEWLNDFHSFLNWALKNGYRDDLTIDRMDSTKPYGPGNCRWVDYFVQEQNKGMDRRNKTGVKGVCKSSGGKYRAYITRWRRRYHLGTFETVQEAEQARNEAEGMLIAQ